jgi:putative glutamine amidotransferase
MRRHTSRRRTLLPLKRTFIEPGTRPHRLLGCGSLRVNSLHNQAIRRLGDGVAVSARDRDDIVQGIEAAGSYTIGGAMVPGIPAALGATSASTHFMR